MYNVTNACNLRCKHCYYNPGLPLRNELTLDEVRAVFKDLYNTGIVEIEFSGGEPFARPDFMRILDMANSMDFSIVILTNGTLIDKQISEKMKGMCIKHIQIPIEGLEETHNFMRGAGTFKHAINTIKILKDDGIKVHVRMTATKQSLKDVEPLAEYMADLEVDSFSTAQFTPIYNAMAYRDDFMLSADEMNKLHDKVLKLSNRYNGKMKIHIDIPGFLNYNQELEEFKGFKGSMSCGALRGDWCVITPDGIVSPCDLVIFYAGSLRKQKFADIWEKSPVFRQFREFEPGLLTGVCGNCEYKVLCGGCRALALLFYGDFYAEDPTCWRVSKESREWAFRRV